MFFTFVQSNYQSNLIKFKDLQAQQISSISIEASNKIPTANSSINNTNKEQLLQLLNLSNQNIDKIIENRPYLSVEEFSRYLNTIAPNNSIEIEKLQL